MYGLITWKKEEKSIHYQCLGKFIMRKNEKTKNDPILVVL